MRIVIDTNVVVSAIFFGGRPRELIDLLIDKRLDAYASTAILTEYKETIDELCMRYPEKPGNIPLSSVVAAINVIEPTNHIEICRDPDDNKFIECAIDSKCVYIVSGDKDLLSIGSYKDVEIVTVTEYLSRFEKNM